jgi:hypothetical protein
MSKQKNIRTLGGVLRKFLDEEYWESPEDGMVLQSLEVEKLFTEMKNSFPCYNPDAGCDLICNNCHLHRLWAKHYFGCLDE